MNIVHQTHGTNLETNDVRIVLHDLIKQSILTVLPFEPISVTNLQKEVGFGTGIRKEVIREDRDGKIA